MHTVPLKVVCSIKSGWTTAAVERVKTSRAHIALEIQPWKNKKLNLTKLNGLKGVSGRAVSRGVSASHAPTLRAAWLFRERCTAIQREVHSYSERCTTMQRGVHNYSERGAQLFSEVHSYSERGYSYSERGAQLFREVHNFQREVHNYSETCTTIQREVQHSRWEQPYALRAMTEVKLETAYTLVSSLQVQLSIYLSLKSEIPYNFVPRVQSSCCLNIRTLTFNLVRRYMCVQCIGLQISMSKHLSLKLHISLCLVCT